MLFMLLCHLFCITCLILSFVRTNNAQTFVVMIEFCCKTDHSNEFVKVPISFPCPLQCPWYSSSQLTPALMSSFRSDTTSDVSNIALKSKAELGRKHTISCTRLDALRVFDEGYRRLESR